MYSTQHSDIASRKSLEVGSSSCEVFVAREARISETIFVTVAVAERSDACGCESSERVGFVVS